MMNPGLLAGSIISSVMALVSFRLHLLTGGGSVAQWILGSILLGIGGWEWTIPMLTFFVFSYLISGKGNPGKEEAASLFAKASQRDAAQVFANGGVGGMIVIASALFPNDTWFVAYLGAVAAASADTWGTELGTLSGTSPRLITTLARVETGRSGGVTLWGTTAAAAGALIVFVSALPWVNGFLLNLFAVIGGGMAGMFADSWFGATLQAQYRCATCARITERSTHCEGSTFLIRGFRWFSNDLVNVFCTIAGGLTSFTLAEVMAG